MLSILGKLFKRKTAAPNQFDALSVQATSAAAAQDFQRAIDLYDQAIALNPSHAEAYYKRGNALKNLGRLDAAIASYDKAIERREVLPKAEDSIIQIGRSDVQLFPSSGKKFQFHRRASFALISANTVSAGIVFTSPASKSRLRR